MRPNRTNFSLFSISPKPAIIASVILMSLRAMTILRYIGMIAFIIKQNCQLLELVGMMHMHTQHGRGSDCPQSRNGKRLPEASMVENIHGAMNRLIRKGSIWQIILLVPVKRQMMDTDMPLQLEAFLMEQVHM